MRGEATLLVTMVIPTWSMQTKSAMTSDLMFFRALLTKFKVLLVGNPIETIGSV